MTTYDDFPIPSDFDNEDEWIHEVCKSDFKYVMHVPKFPGYLGNRVVKIFRRMDYVYLEADEHKLHSIGQYEIATDKNHSFVILITSPEKWFLLFAKNRDNLEAYRKDVYAEILKYGEEMGDIQVATMESVIQDFPISAVSKYTFYDDLTDS